jgi:hypothetical protein
MIASLAAYRVEYDDPLPGIRLVCGRLGCFESWSHDHASLEDLVRHAAGHERLRHPD